MLSKLCIDPVERSSIIVTLAPLLISFSAKCDPTKPAPPVIR